MYNIFRRERHIGDRLYASVVTVATVRQGMLRRAARDQGCPLLRHESDLHQKLKGQSGRGHSARGMR